MTFTQPLVQRWRKKPVIVEAYKTDVDLEVVTVEGNRVLVPAGAYVVTDMKGFQYPCDAEIFEAIHELMPD